MKTKFFSAAVIAMAMFATSSVFTSCGKNAAGKIKLQQTLAQADTHSQNPNTPSDDDAAQSYDAMVLALH